MFKQMRNERGQTIVILALAMVVLLLFVALAVDGGNIYAKKRQAQNASDAAALAAVRQLVTECGQEAGPNAQNIIDQVALMVDGNAPGATAKSFYLRSDQSKGTAVSADLPVLCDCGNGANRAAGVEVDITYPAPTFLAGLIGRKTVDISVKSRALSGPVRSVAAGIGPITRPIFDAGHPLIPNQETEVRFVDDGGGNTGSFGWLSWTGSPSASALSAALTPPGTSQLFVDPVSGDHELEIGSWVSTATGNMNSVRDTLQNEWINPGRVMIIPLYDSYQGNGSNKRFHIGGFAAIKLTGIHTTGNDKYLTAIFLKFVAPGDWDPSATCQQEGGVYSVKLIP